MDVSYCLAGGRTNIEWKVQAGEMLHRFPNNDLAAV